MFGVFVRHHVAITVCIAFPQTAKQVWMREQLIDQ